MLEEMHRGRLQALKLIADRLETRFKSPAKPWVAPFLAFLIPLGIRAVPEILMGPFIVGFDPLAYYIPYTLTWLREGVNFWPFLGSSPFLYILLIGITSIGVPIVLLLKIMSPLLLGCLGIVVYFYANKTLSWSPKKSMIAVFFSTLYFVALRVSWDMLRSELALIFLFTALIFLEKDKPRTFLNGVLLSIAMVSVVFAHQIVGAIMIAIIIVTLTRLSLEKQTHKLRRLIICSIPILLLFSAIVYADATSPQYSVMTGFSQDSDLFSTLSGFTSYADLLVNTAGFLVFCYLPLMPLLLFGYKSLKSNLPIKVWVSFMFVMILAILITANVFFSVLPYRLILLLTYPLSFYAAEAFSRLKLNRYRICTGLILATFTLSFVVLPYEYSFPYYNLFPTYVPRSMLMNTVPLSDCQDTEIAIQWASNNMSINSSLLVHYAFYGWASLTVNSSQIIPYGFGNPELVAQELSKNSSSNQFYLIWWANRSGWFGQPPLSSDFKEIYQSGRIAVFIFTSNSGANSDSNY